jgi:hypothetical protein
MTTGYLVFPTLRAAQDRSHAEALARGCKPGDVTQWWWEVTPHPLVPGSFLMLLDDTRPAFAKATLPPVERLQVQADQAVLTALTAAVAELPA